MLQEVVVVGYGVQRKSDLTGAVASVKAADALKNTPTGNVSDALQGRMAGVSVLSGSGNPTEDNTIRVRGINSITAETGPLVVIDGFIGGSLQSLNPSDIQSIEVLKDASATAVYGSRGANGVILVTTKNPSQDKLTVSFNAFANIKTVAKYADNLSTYEYANLVNDYGKEYFGYGDNHYYSAEQLAASSLAKQVMITQEKSSAALPLHRTMKCLLQVVAKRLLSWHLSAIKTMKVSSRSQVAKSTAGV